MNQFVDAWKDVVLKNYANFAGRLSVGGYWRAFAVNFVLGVVLAILGQAASLFFVLYIVFALAILVPGIAAGVRRLHDIGKSGVMILVGLIPIVGAILLIVWFVQAGNPAANEYGPPPA